MGTRYRRGRRPSSYVEKYLPTYEAAVDDHLTTVLYSKRFQFNFPFIDFWGLEQTKTEQTVLVFLVALGKPAMVT